MKLKFFFLLLLSLYIVNCTFYIEAQATIRFVSKTGTSTPPYTSWQTAADSIQKCINICSFGDTVYVGIGNYIEKVTVDITITIFGISMDSCIIDGSNEVSDEVVKFNEHGRIENFTIQARGNNEFTDAIRCFIKNIIVRNCKIINAEAGIVNAQSSSVIENCIFLSLDKAIWDECPADTCKSLYRNNIIISKSAQFKAVSFGFGGYPSFLNNISIEEGNTVTGVQVQYHKGVLLKNNLVSGYRWQNIYINQITGDTAYVINNNSINVSESSLSSEGAIVTGSGDRTIVKNNIIMNSGNGISTYVLFDSVKSDYNLFWNVPRVTYGGAYLGDGNITADPMFVNDTIPTANGNYDFHLQKYSPAIDKGDPAILDVDGSRSDIGMFGGPLGQKYTYQDLAPKPPRNLTASMDSGLVHLKWNKNTEADLFRYRVYRDTVPDFIYDTTKIIAVISDTIFYDDPPQKFISGNYYYKITAIDSAYHQSSASEEVHINITGIPEAPPIVVEHYNLLQNYPNPFNPGTTIPYRLKAPGYVKVMVYNLLGEQVKVLVNKHQSAGYYEVLFHPTETERQSSEGKIEFETGYGDIVSGIYLYRIEVIGEGNIPVFTDMKKMMLVK
jgi:hypothetical protein